MDFERIITISAVVGNVVFGIAFAFTRWRSGAGQAETKLNEAERKLAETQDKRIALYEKQINDAKEREATQVEQAQRQSHEIGDMQGQLKGAKDRIQYLENLIKENPELTKRLDGIGKVAEAAVLFMTSQTKWMKDQDDRTKEMAEILGKIKLGLMPATTV